MPGMHFLYLEADFKQDLHYHKGEFLAKVRRSEYRHDSDFY